MMFTIDIRFTVDEAITLMRVIAAKESRENDTEKRDDLELIRLRLYDQVYHRPVAAVRMDLAA
jgi:hypothetical protein